MRNRFKRVSGFVIGVGGFVLKLSGYEALGEILEYVGGALGIYGYGHSLKKNYEKDGDTYVDKIKMFRVVAEAIIKIIGYIIELTKRRKKP